MKFNNLYNSFNNQKIIIVNQKRFLINPLFDQQPETTFEMVDEAVQAINTIVDLSKVNKVLGEEDRGGFLSTIFAYKNKLPFGMVKWNPNGLIGQIKIDFRMAYKEGTLYFNGVTKGDKILIVEDLIDSGGTLSSLIKALQQNEIEIVDCVAIAEIEEMNGAEKIYKETGIMPKYIYKVSRLSELSKITWINPNIDKA